MNYLLTNFDDIPPVPCPCGLSKRAFVHPDSPASIHYVDISENARTHYHKTFTEIYLILETEGDAFIELDGELLPVTPMTTIMIKPGCRHRAVGKMKIINTAIPTFNPDDEWFD
ncbi:MAG: cupin domain-containing protein [Verrucomicrobiaceae bacterium]